MGRRGRKAQHHAAISEPTSAREDLERRWLERIAREPALATLVTSAVAHGEPFHRWIHYRQGFSPGLVRRFLAELDIAPARSAKHPVFDPFSGSGTVVIECARRNTSAIGAEALASLVFLSRARFERAFPPFPAADHPADWRDVAEQCALPIHRAALMLAVGRRHASDGSPNRGAPPLDRSLAEVAGIMAEDLVHPLSVRNDASQGDARRMTTIENDSVGAILSSPPYLSRHNYARIAGPYEEVYRYWYPDEAGPGEGVQVRAHPRARGEFHGGHGIAPGAEEAARWLEQSGEPKLAGVVRVYFDDLRSALGECLRVLLPGAACWWVVGGARLKGVYVPSDLVIADMAELLGFEVSSIRVARDLIDSRRKFGRIGHVAPRESILVMAKPR